MRSMISHDMNNLNNRINSNLDTTLLNLGKIHQGKSLNRIQDRILKECKIQDLHLLKLLRQAISQK